MKTRLFTAYLLHFAGPLHIGDHRDDYGMSLHTIASDTMYAALTATLAKIGEAIPENGDLGCTISSLFPYYQPNQQAPAVLFFPRPMTHNFTDANATDIKKLKKIAWLDQSYLEKLIAGETLLSSQALEHVHGEYLTAQEFEPFLDSQVKVRVMVSREGKDAKPFYMDDLYFKGHSGMYFLVEGDTSNIDKALPLLAQEGIGTDRNVGHGYFEYTKQELTIQVPETTEVGMILSTFIPRSKAQLEQTLTHDCVAYELLRRGGWITTAPYNTLRKNVIHAFAAGSVLSSLPSGAGKIVNLAPKMMVSHPIWRCGKAIVLPIKA